MSEFSPRKGPKLNTISKLSQRHQFLQPVAQEAEIKGPTLLMRKNSHLRTEPVANSCSESPFSKTKSTFSLINSKSSIKHSRLIHISSSIHSLKRDKKITGSPEKINEVLKQYETRLRLSCENWLLFDYRKDSYRRGWKPGGLCDFSGLLRLVLMRAFLDLKQQFEAQDLDRLSILVNPQLLQEQIELKRQSKLSQQKDGVKFVRHSISRKFQAGTVIKLHDLMALLILTNFDDILEYSLMAIGYLTHCYYTGQDPCENLNPIVGAFTVSKKQQLLQYFECFTKYGNCQILPCLGMLDSLIRNEEKLIFESTPNDICRLYLDLQAYKMYQKIIAFREYRCRIKFRLGNHHWETRLCICKCMNLHLVMNRSEKTDSKSETLSPPFRDQTLTGFSSFCAKLNPLNSFYTPDIPEDTGEDRYQTVFYWRNTVISPKSDINNPLNQNFSVLCKNKLLNVVIILGDCKFGMAEIDIRTIEKWVRNMKKPILEDRHIHARLMPLMRALDHEDDSPLKASRRLQTTTE